MAPAASKCGFTSEQQDFFGFFGKVALDQFAQVCDDACKVIAFVQDCLRSAAKATESAGAFLSGPLLESSLRILACLKQSLSHCRGPEQPASGVGGEPKASRSLIEGMPMLFVAHVVSFLYASFVFGYMPAAGVAMSSPVGIAFHALMGMVLASYAKVCTTDPGATPDTPEWRTPGRPPAHLTERKLSSSRARWCRKTQAYKPDRAHYCRASGRVVLRMDHHCPWLGNTIGFRNHKHFFLFLMYTTSACTLTGGALLRLLLFSTLPPSTVIFILESSGVTFLLSSVLVPLFLFHSWLLARNMTTIEFCEQRRAGASSRAPGNGSAQASRYDLGLYRNIASVFGESPATWLLPVGGPSGDGVRFAEESGGTTSSGSDQKAMVGAEEDKDEDASTTAEEYDPPRKGQASEPRAEPERAQAEEPLESVLASCACVNQLVQDAAARLVAICCGRPTRRSDVPTQQKTQDPSCSCTQSDGLAAAASAGISDYAASLGREFL